MILHQRKGADPSDALLLWWIQVPPAAAWEKASMAFEALLEAYSWAALVDVTFWSVFDLATTCAERRRARIQSEARDRGLALTQNLSGRSCQRDGLAGHHLFLKPV